MSCTSQNDKIMKVENYNLKFAENKVTLFRLADTIQMQKDPVSPSCFLLQSRIIWCTTTHPNPIYRFGPHRNRTLLPQRWRLNWTIINRITIDLRIELANYKQQYLPVNLPNSSNISSLPFDFGILPTKRRRFGTLMLIFKHFPVLISKLSSCGL